MPFCEIVCTKVLISKDGILRSLKFINECCMGEMGEIRDVPFIQEHLGRRRARHLHSGW